MSTYEAGQRVVTKQYGAGTIDNFELANHAWSGQLPVMRPTGRLGIRLDVWPFPHWDAEVAYFWPNELEAP